MNAKRVVTFGAAGAVLAAMLAGAATTGRRSVEPVPRINTSAVELRGAELAAEIARLRERLRPTDGPRRPARNLFQFGAGRVAREEPIAVTLPSPAIADLPPRPAAAPLKLVGMAQDAGADGTVRTAIISGLGDLFLVKEGESVTPRFRVVTISDGAVELVDLEAGTTLRLALN